MAKTTGPLFSEKAQGAIGGVINFSGWKGRNRVKINAKPKNPRSIAQQDNRALLAEAVTAWQSLPLEEKLMWEQWQ